MMSHAASFQPGRSLDQSNLGMLNLQRMHEFFHACHEEGRWLERGLTLPVPERSTLVHGRRREKFMSITMMRCESGLLLVSQSTSRPFVPVSASKVGSGCFAVRVELDVIVGELRAVGVHAILES
jgi:hypothetical protein